MHRVVKDLDNLLKQQPYKAPPERDTAHKATEPVAEVHKYRVMEGCGLALGLMLALRRSGASVSSFDLPLSISVSPLSSSAVLCLRVSFPRGGHKEKSKRGPGASVLPSHKKNLEKTFRVVS